MIWVSWVDVLAIGLALPGFAIGARQDFGRRMVKDWVWLLVAPSLVAGLFAPFLAIRTMMAITALAAQVLAAKAKKTGGADVIGFPLFVFPLGPLELMVAIGTLPLWAKLTDWKRTPLVTCFFFSMVVGLCVALALLILIGE